MDIKQLLEKMEEFAGEKVGQKSGDQWRGTDKGTPGKKLVGDSIIKDLSKGPTPKTKEQELAEEWATFSEENIGTHPKRARRTSDRHLRGHEPQARYKTVKADEAANPAQQAAIAIAMKKAGKKPKQVDVNEGPVTKAIGSAALAGALALGSPGAKAQGTEQPVAEPAATQQVQQQVNAKLVLKDFGNAFTLPHTVLKNLPLNKITQDQLIDVLGDPEAAKTIGATTLIKYRWGVSVASVTFIVKNEIVVDAIYKPSDEASDAGRSLAGTGELLKAFGTKKGSIWSTEPVKASELQSGEFNEGVAYKTANPHPALQDPIVAKVVKQMRPGLKNLDMNNEAFLYFAYEIGKMRAREMWEDYGPAIKYFYQSGIGVNEDANTDNKLAKLLTRFVNQHEGTDRAVALDAIEYIKKIGHIEQFATSLDYFAVDLDEGLEEASYYGPVEARWMVKLSDDEGDHLKTYHDKFPSLSAAKKAYKNTPYATDFKYKPVKKDQVEEAVGQDSFNRAGFNPLRDQRDYLDKFKDLWDLYHTPNLDPQTKAETKQRILDLNASARAKGFIQSESRGHTVIANKLKDVERAKKFASGELKIPTPQERQAQLAKQKDKKEKVDEYGANNPPQGTTTTTPTAPQKVDPKQAQQIAQNLNVEKTALGQLKQLNPSINPQKAALAATKDIATMNPQEKEVLAQVAKTLSPALGSPAFGSIKTALQKSQAQAKNN